VGNGGEITQALHAHMNKLKIEKKEVCQHI
jgi:hypothetical protein